MASVRTLTKQPSEVIDVDWNLDKFLDTPTTNGDYVTGVTVVVSSATDGVPANLLLGPGTLPETQILAGKTSGLAGQRVKVWLGGGLNGVTYKITVVATLNSLRVNELDFQIRVREI
jgi:hypothetical protein